MEKILFQASNADDHSESFARMTGMAEARDELLEWVQDHVGDQFETLIPLIPLNFESMECTLNNEKTRSAYLAWGLRVPRVNLLSLIDGNNVIIKVNDKVVATLNIPVEEN